MKKLLSVNLSCNDSCQLVSEDVSDYNEISIEDLSQYVFCEFILYKDVLLESSVVIRPATDTTNYTFNLSDDGTYTYHKFLIPKLEYFWSVGDEKYILLPSELFYYNDKIYVTTAKPFMSNEDPNEIIKMCPDLPLMKVITPISNALSSRYFISTIFSVCNLNNCLIKLQKDSLFNTSCLDENKSHRDLLLTAMYVFNYLIDAGNFSEAQRLLDSMGDCFYQSMSIDNTCNCGKV